MPSSSSNCESISVKHPGSLSVHSALLGTQNEEDFETQTQQFIRWETYMSSYRYFRHYKPLVLHERANMQEEVPTEDS